MFNQILDNELYKILIRFGVFILPFIISGIHFKKYNFLQGLISFLCIPMIILGIIELILLKQSDARIIEFYSSLSDLYKPYLELHRSLYKLTTWKWLFDSGWIYFPTVLIFILSWGFSITKRKNDKKNKKKEKKEKQ